MPDHAGIKSNLFRAIDGQYSFDPLFIVQPPGTYSLLQVNFGNFGKYQTVFDQQKITFLLDAPLIFVYSRECAIGERYTNRHTCEQCPEGRSTYEIRNATMKGIECDACLSFGVCAGRFIFPDNGFVRMSHKA